MCAYYEWLMATGKCLKLSVTQKKTELPRKNSYSQTWKNTILLTTFLYCFQIRPLSLQCKSTWEYFLMKIKDL